MYEKAFGVLRLPRVVYPTGSWEQLQEFYWPIDQGTNILVQMVKCAIIRTSYSSNRLLCKQQSQFV